MEPLEALRELFPRLAPTGVRTIEDGWDNLVLEVCGTYVFRFPRRPEVVEWVEREIALLPGLAERLPVSVPRFEFVGRNGVRFVGYRKLPGSPAVSGLNAGTGEDLGRFLRALHAIPVADARAAGVPCFAPAEWRDRYERFGADLRERVVPLLSREERRRAKLLLSSIASLEFQPALVHADLGPAHVLCTDGRVTGVIDWSDARFGDPALDLAWCLHGTPAVVAERVAQVYDVDDGARERSLFYRRLGPWYEVVHGLDTGAERFVRSGLDGVRARLPS
jgi:aminoglycoside phosphotransferase (APT) family kinase protein